MKWGSIENAPKNSADKIDLWIPVRGARIPDCMWRVPEQLQRKSGGDAVWCYFHGEWSEWVELNEEPSHWMRVEGPAEE